MKLLPKVKETPLDSAFLFSLLSSLSALIKAECIEGKISFLAQGGMQLLRSLLIEDTSRRVKQKTVALLFDLLYYDPQIQLVFPNFPSLRANLPKDKELTTTLVQSLDYSTAKSDTKVREFAARCLA